jgi:hypothetical protein
MPRHPEPDFVTAYKEWLKAGPPKCCHTCDHYGQAKYNDPPGHCREFNMEPPEEFAATVDACASWTQELPF